MYQGCYTALITPFRDGQIDVPSLLKLIAHQLQGSIDGIVVMGTTGEASTVSMAEHERLIEIVVKECGGRVPVIAGVGSNSPQEAISLARHAHFCGADAVLAVAGYYNRPSQEGLYQHFKALHDATELPIVVYNIPPRTIVDIQPDTLARIAELPRIAGIKDACGDLGRICHERQRIRKPFSFLSGDDMTALAYNANGGNGCISVTSNVLPGLCTQLQQHCAAGDYHAALALHERLVPLHAALFREPNPAGIKYAASLLGLCREECRLPMVPLTDPTRLAIRTALEAVLHGA
ncbi:MAG TPA: 4-hydroxy-tetrahydrodipicolinate synthase [Candidatus Acidoferrum sp.]|nr:4-hydroxy-tetrahydrodipicolinate synthase [Candidatus Acidoferrum sp.]